MHALQHVAEGEACVVPSTLPLMLMKRCNTYCCVSHTEQ